MNLDQEIETALGKLMGGDGDPKEVLRDLVQRARGSGSVVIQEKVHECMSCGEKDVLCFRCKAHEVVGEKAYEAAPGVAMMLGSQVSQWLRERKARKATEAAEAASRAHAAPPPPPPPAPGWTPPPPPPGRQTF